MLQNSVDNLRLLCYDADVPKRTCCTGGNKTRRGLPPLPERRDALEKITAERVLAELAEIAFADLGAEPAPPVKVGDKLPNLFVVTILNYDLFGKGYMKYCVHNHCEEVPSRYGVWLCPLGNP